MIDFSNIPNNPGCYLFKDKKDKVIYVGKAKNLKKRVKSYFSKTGFDPKTEVMLSHVDSVDFIATDNEVEALILESNLIKKNSPKYNINLKDSKRFAYIQLTDDDFPRILYARRPQGKGKFYGPFVSAAARDDIIWILKKTFQIRTCKRMPKKACLRYHIDLCLAPCIGNVNKKEYQDVIKKVKMVLKGKTGELVKDLTSEMKKAARQEKFERALELRNQLSAIKWLSEKQNMQRLKRYNEDILNYEVKDEKVYLILFNVYKGILENKQEFEFDYNDHFFEEFIVQYYSENQVPKELILPQKIEEPLVSFLRKKREGAVGVSVPQKGDKKRLLDLVQKNVELTFFGDTEKLEDLQKRLKLQDMPVVIECFDVSHLSGTSTVASMVQFRNAKPDKSNYRRFKIRTVEGIDDFAAIGEVVKRRYKRLKKEEQNMPDLVIIDGGLGQLNSAIKEIEELGLRIPVISIAKKLEEIYVPGISFPISLSKKSKAQKLIQEIRDEAHRFALSYSKVLRKKEMIS
ncbi:MAG: excinuclease ABC subunit C [Methanomassiliicoccales archaeon]|nr:MAG: excinuclease ABC subunit C [Methanomassiliicoccales archaeon]